jgi:hypothetical protein
MRLCYGQDYNNRVNRKLGELARELGGTLMEIISFYFNTIIYIQISLVILEVFNIE